MELLVLCSSAGNRRKRLRTAVVEGQALVLIQVIYAALCEKNMKRHTRRPSKDSCDLYMILVLIPLMMAVDDRLVGRVGGAL